MKELPGATIRGQQVRLHECENGLRIASLHDPRAPIFSLQTWFGVGSAHEQIGKTGISHLFEHLMFSGTSRFPAGEFDRVIESHGGDSNAATWVDWTYYRMNLPSSQLELAVTLEADRMQSLLLTPEIVEAERHVVLNERLERVDDDVDGFLSEKLFELAFDQHPYRIPTIGWQSDIENLSLADLQRFYRDHYGPQNALLVAVGDVEESTLLSLVERHYGHLERSHTPNRPNVVEPEHEGERIARFTKEVPAARIVMAYPAPAQSDPDWAVTQLVATLLVGGPSSPLYRELVIEQQSATSVSADTMPFRDRALFEIAISCSSDGDEESVIAAVDGEMARLASGEISESELAKAKRCMLTDFWSDLVSVGGKAEAIGHHLLVTGGLQSLINFPDRVSHITTGEVSRTCEQYLQRSQRVVVIAEPSTT